MNLLSLVPQLLQLSCNSGGSPVTRSQKSNVHFLHIARRVPCKVMTCGNGRDFAVDAMTRHLMISVVWYGSRVRPAYFIGGGSPIARYRWGNFWFWRVCIGAFFDYTSSPVWGVD